MKGYEDCITGFIAREHFINKLKECSLNNDYLQAHLNADKIICELLKDLGYMEIAEIYQQIIKREG